MILWMMIPTSRENFLMFTETLEHSSPCMVFAESICLLSTFERTSALKAATNLSLRESLFAGTK